jgi:hypothetical protein
MTRFQHSLISAAVVHRGASKFRHHGNKTAGLREFRDTR